MGDESQGNGAPQAPQGSGAPGASSGSGGAFSFASEDEFNERLNRAITGRLRDFEKKVDGKFGEIQTGLSGFGSKFDEFGKVIEGLKKPADAPKPKDAPPTMKLEDFPEWKANQALLEELRKKSAAAEQAAASERAKNRATALRASLADQLTKVAGIPADNHRYALALLITEDGRVGYSEDGKGDAIVWRQPDGSEVTLDEGLKSWARSPEAKKLQPPQNPKGSGGGAGRAAGGGAQEHPDDILASAFHTLARGGVR